MIVDHTLPPWYDEHSLVLILGTMPSVRSREIVCYYGHPQNRFWSTMEGVFEEEIPASADARRRFCLNHKIALWDVLASCDIRGSQDASIKNPIPNDISRIVKESSIKAIFTTGKAAKSLYDTHIFTHTRIEAISLPSTSPANRRWASDERLLQEFKQIRDLLK